MGCKVTAVAVLLMIVMSVAAEAQLQPFQPVLPPAKPSPSPPSIVGCGAKCAFKCIRVRFPPLMALCIGLCMIQCRHSPSAKVYNCTNGCASTLLTNSIATDSIGTDRVSDYVESCYQTCSRNERL
ncbi:hypothetical protein K2173_009784 [Erythroxylum novogranatense]|uniref:Thionin-like protein n=1 Tax=Erythroxylum novogranatense TaxID=1862640 RepID=A0AAV8TSV3_9ROSI|nr:hypothetical protein K2173_012417 [Erythroxylum novogranatense]KAJ8770035.1 hypothetical protein K2173_009784 [Erythroxylum novogranatense]